MGRRRFRRRGFTLIEILVVISIIAVLMGILVPVLRRARGTARRIVCMSTLKSIYMVHKQYTIETGKYLPHTNRDPYTPWYNHDGFRRGMGLEVLTTEQKTRRSYTLQEWAPNVPRHYICPEARWALNHAEKGLYAIDRSYGVNIDGDHEAWKQQLGPDKESWVRSPGENILIADALDWWISYRKTERYNEYGEQWLGILTYGATAFRHHGGSNIAFWDGHVGWVSMERITTDERLWDTLK